jgi:F-type H+-transporting ATPase subunit b
MLLDWFTIFAQIVNFFVLIVLLKLFLYKPIVEAMRERKARIAHETQELREARIEADSLKAELRRKHEDLEKRESEVMSEIQAEAEKWRQQAMASADAEIEIMRKEWLAELEREKESVGLNLRKKLVHEVSATAARIVRDLSGSDLEQLIFSGFMHRIAEEARGMQCGNSDILIRTGFEYDDPQEQKIQQLLKGLFPAQNERIFITDARLGLGIELIAGDRKWEWNLNSYVTELENKILHEINS